MKIWIKKLDIQNPTVIETISKDWSKKYTTSSTIFFSAKGLIKLKDHKLFQLEPTFSHDKNTEDDHICCDYVEWKLQKEIHQLPHQHTANIIRKTLYEKKNINFNLVVEYLNDVLHDIYFIPNKPDITSNNFTLCVNEFY